MITSIKNIPTKGNRATEKKATLYKAINDYEVVKARIQKEAEFRKYMDNSPEIFNRLFTAYARAKQIIKYEIGIFKEIRTDKDGRIAGVVNSNWDSEASIKEAQGDKVRLAIINEEIADNEAIQEYYNDEY